MPVLRRTLLVLLATLLATTVALLVAAEPAAAHAQLESTSVADSEVLESSPSQISLEWTEPVSVSRGGIRVFDSSGERVDDADAHVAERDPHTTVVGLERDLPDGTYAVTYRVTSADGHPVAGAFVFSVGSEQGSGDDLVAAVFDTAGDRPFAVAGVVLRWLGYLGMLVAAGGAVALWWLRQQVDAPSPRLLRRIRVAALAAAAAGVLGLFTQNALVTGNGIAALVDPAGLADVVGSPVGWSAGARLLGLGLLVAGLPGLVGGGRRVSMALAGAAVAVASPLLEGHTLTTGPGPVVWLGDAAHLAAAATWTGGLVVVLSHLRTRRVADDPVGAGRLVARFSDLAGLSVVVVTVAGLALAWAEVRALRALTSTAYGWTLLVKSVLVLPLLALGAHNHYRLVPRIARRRRRRPEVAGAPVPAGGADDPADRAAAWSTLRRTVTVEIAVIAAVLGVTAVLVALQPAAEAAGVTGAYTTTTQLGDAWLMTITVDPNRVGRNEVHLYLLSESGRPADLGEAVTIALTQITEDIGPIRREPVVAGPGHYVLAGPELSVPGLWQIRVEVAVDRFEVISETVEVTVNP